MLLAKVSLLSSLCCLDFKLRAQGECYCLYHKYFAWGAMPKWAPEPRAWRKEWRWWRRTLRRERGDGVNLGQTSQARASWNKRPKGRTWTFCCWTSSVCSVSIFTQKHDLSVWLTWTSEMWIISVSHCSQLVDEHASVYNIHCKSEPWLHSTLTPFFPVCLFTTESIIRLLVMLIKRNLIRLAAHFFYFFLSKKKNCLFMRTEKRCRKI